MKKLFAMFCAVIMLTAALTGCMDRTMEQTRKDVTEVVSGIREDLDARNDETVRPTETPTVREDETTIMEDIEDTVDSMIDDGKVKDGDGNVGDLEKADDDSDVKVW